MKKIDLAYFAGFFDGEGSVTIHENGSPSPRGKVPNHTLQVSIGNTDPRVLEILHQQFGGSLTIRYVVKKNHRNVAQWTIRAAKTLPFLEAIFPYLRMKLDVVAVAIDFQKTKSMSGPKRVSEEDIKWRESRRRRIRELNAKPWILGARNEDQNPRVLLRPSV
ncbi:MAG: LAGLIDADG family homing endonuclease [Pseudomonadota bacterium]